VRLVRKARPARRVSACARACVRARVRACVCARVRACVRAQTPLRAHRLRRLCTLNKTTQGHAGCAAGMSGRSSEAVRAQAAMAQGVASYR
jgi:hypothetical protein